MRRILTPLLPALAALAHISLASAQEPDSLPPDTSVIEVEGVTVAVARAVTSPGGTSALELRLDSLPVPPAPTLEQVLREVPLLQVRTNSRGEAQPALRGSEERQIAILVDGVPLTLGWDHRTDLSVIPLTAIQTLRVHRGLSSILHGPNVLGGVLEVGVGRADAPVRAPRPLELSAGVDHTGARSGGIVGGRAVGLGEGRALVRGGLGYRGRSALPVPGGVSELGADDGERLNSDLEHVDGFLSTRWRGYGGSWLSASASGYRAERGVPAELHLDDPRFWRYPLQWRGIGAVSGGTGQRLTRWGQGDLEASLGVDAGRTEIDAFESAAYDRVVEREEADDRTVTLRLLGDHTLADEGELRAAFTYADVSHDEVISRRQDLCQGGFEDGFCVGAPAEYRQRLWSLAGEVAGGAFGARLSAGLAVDGADTPESGDKPPLGSLTEWGGRVGATRLVGSRVLLHAGVSRRARFPSLRELYSGALGRFEPNPNLRPEAQVAGELGATWRRDRHQVQAVGFHHRLSDAVVRVPTEEGRLRRENREEVRSTGLELLASTSVGRLGVAGDLTLQRVRVEQSGSGAGELPAEYHPEVMAGVDLGYVLPAEIRAAGGLTYMGEQFCVTPDSPDAARLDAWTRVDASLSRGWRLRSGSLGSLSATLAVDNLLDRTAFDQCGLPQPGRLLRVQVRVF